MSRIGVDVGDTAGVIGGVSDRVGVIVGVSDGKDVDVGSGVCVGFCGSFVGFGVDVDVDQGKKVDVGSGVLVLVRVGIVVMDAVGD